jgi:hypothetical protein
VIRSEAAAIVLWVFLLDLGVRTLFTLAANRHLRFVVGFTLLGQLAMHMVFGEETFLYSIHFGPLLIILAALSTLTRVRPAALLLAGALALAAGINNGMLFVCATKLVQCIEGTVR